MSVQFKYELTDAQANMADNLASDDKEPGKVYISSLIEYLVEMRKDADEILLENEITKEYIDLSNDPIAKLFNLP